MINQLIYQQCSCMDALSFFFSLNDLEVKLYFVLVQHQQQTVTELMELVDRNQSTVYTALEKLVAQGVVTKTKRGRRTRGYEYVYRAVGPEQVRELLRKRLDQLYSSISSCLENFEQDALSCEINQ
jgi:predicted transcriptional regulator